MQRFALEVACDRDDVRLRKTLETNVMKIPVFSMGSDEWMRSAADQRGIEPMDCDPNKDCTFRYPCPIFRNPGRKCTGSNPACVAQREVCRKDKRTACIVHAIRAYRGTASCVSAAAAGGVLTPALCGLAAVTIRNAVNDCNGAF